MTIPKETILRLKPTRNRQQQLLIGISLILLGAVLIYFSYITILPIIGIIVIGLGISNISKSISRYIFKKNRVIFKIWLYEKSVVINSATKLLERIGNSDEDGDNLSGNRILVIETGDQSIKIPIDIWENYADFKEAIVNTIRQSELSNTYTNRENVKVIVTSSDKLPMPNESFLYEKDPLKHKNQEKSRLIGVGFGLFISLAGLISFFIKIYSVEDMSDANISSEPFLMATGIALAIYFAMFSKKKH